MIDGTMGIMANEYNWLCVVFQINTCKNESFLVSYYP